MASLLLKTVAAAGLGAALGMTAVPPASAGDCEARVVGVASLNQYDHFSGRGFLAVRVGPNSRFRQVGELYRGDIVSVYDRQGNWYHVTCMSGVCSDPYWGDPQPSGWVSGRYLGGFAGVCP